MSQHLRNWSPHSIAYSILLQEEWLNENVRFVPDIAPEFSGVDGHTIEPEGADKVMERVQMLYELANLSKPMNYTCGTSGGPNWPDSPWGYAMAMGDCPCGMSGEQWARWVAHRDGHDDPMGQHMGVNE